MMSNSPRPFPSTWPPPSTIVSSFRGEFAWPLPVPKPVENAVHHLGFLIGKEGMSDVDIFGNGDARRDVVARQDLVGPGAEDGAEDRVDAGETPSFGELFVDQRIDLELLAHHTLDEVAEKGRLGIAILGPLDLLAQAMLHELGDHLVQIDAGHVHLIERLDGGKPRGAPRACPFGGLAAPRHGASAGSLRRNAARVASG